MLCNPIQSEDAAVSIHVFVVVTTCTFYELSGRKQFKTPIDAPWILEGHPLVAVRSKTVAIGIQMLFKVRVT